MLVKVLLVLFLYIHVIGSQREFESCVENQSRSEGRCRKVNVCISAREDFRVKGINPTFCSPSAGEPIVCCRDTANYTESTVRPHRPINQPADGLRISDRKCQQYSRGVTQNIDYISLLPEPEVMSFSIAKCDYDNTALILGGKDADLGEFPHMAALGWPLLGGGYAYKCGGSLISDRYVMTAGHCLRVGRDPSVSSSQPTVVTLGDHNLNGNVYDAARPIEVPIKRTIAHPEYRPPVRYHDIALVEMADSVTFTAEIRPCCLWSRPSFVNTRAVATGWGIVNTRTNKQSEVLQKVTLDIMSNEVCDPLLKHSKNRLWSGFADTQMCAGVLAGGKDTCRGDSGGPLQVVSKENQCIFHVVGITSFGGACAAVNQPAVYTRVSSYLGWIESIVWPQG